MEATKQDELVRLLGISRSFKMSKALNLAGKLGIVTLCHANPKGLTLHELCDRLGFRYDLTQSESDWPQGSRGAADYLDLLVSMNVLQRQGSGPQATYHSHPSTSRYLVEGSPDNISGILTLNNDRSAPLFEYLEQGLRNGQVPPEARQRVPDIETVFSTSAGSSTAAGGAEHFALGMLGASIGNFRRLATAMDFSRYKTVVDIGGSTGCCCVALCDAHPHLAAITCDLPAVRPTAERHVQEHGMTDRVEVRDLDFFSDEAFPKADVIVMGMVLHDWGLEKKKLLIRKARAALNPGGALVAVEHLIDDERMHASAALASSLNMLLEFGRESAFDFSFAEFCSWTREAGFSNNVKIPLIGTAHAAVAYL